MTTLRKMRHLLKPIRRFWIEHLVIKTAVKPRGPSLPSKRPLASVYEVVKSGLKSYGYYEQFKQYDPGYYVEKYTYKPQKRLSGYLGQTIHKSKTSTSYNKFRKTHSGFSRDTKCHKHGFFNSKSSYCSQ